MALKVCISLGLDNLKDVFNPKFLGVCGREIGNISSLGITFTVSLALRRVAGATGLSDLQDALPMDNGNHELPVYIRMMLDTI